MSRIIVLSDCRVPTLPVGGHGLGRLAHDIARAMVLRGHDVSLCGGVGSVFDEGDLIVHDDENTRAKTMKADADALYVDLSHYHQFGVQNPDAKVLDWIVDGECGFTPVNAIVSTEYDLQFHRTASVVPVGVDVDNIPFYPVADLPKYLVFAAKIAEPKGYKDALRIHHMQDKPVKFVGERFTHDKLPDWRETLTGRDFHNFVGNALGLVHPVNKKWQLGGGRMPLEAGAMGVPALVYSTASTRDHVKHCVTGFVCKDFADMLDAVQDLDLIYRRECREYIADTRNLQVMCDALEREFERFGS
jgi:glycosyltransferase involved in cell wall biosynthesis